MIATSRGLFVLCAVAVALVAFVIVDVARERGSLDRALVPGFDEKAVTALAWTGHPVGPYLGVRRATAQEPWRRTVPTEGEVEPRAVADVLATLRGARWHRVKAAGERGPIMLEVTWDGRRTPIFVEMVAEGAAQGWVTIGERAYLVDAWVVRALSPDPVTFAIRRPLIAFGEAPEVRIAGLVIAGAPRRLGAEMGGVVLDPAIVDELEATIGNLEIAVLAREMKQGASALTISFAGTEAKLGGTCNEDPALVTLWAPSGGGCVTAKDAGAVTALVEKLRSGALAIGAHQPVPFAPLRITLPDGEVLDLAKRPMIGAKLADDTAVSELLAALSLPATAREMTSGSAETFTGPTMVVEGARDRVTLQLDRTRRTVRRAGDPLVLELAEGAFATLMRPASAYAQLSLWAEDPLTITRLDVSGRVFARGAVVGEWSNAAAPAAVDAVVQRLANPQVLAPARWPARSTRTDTVRITVTEPTGNERQHALRVASTGTECVADATPNAVGQAPGERMVVALEPSICTLIAGAR